MGQITTLENAIGHIQSNKRVFIHGGAATPKILIDELIRQSDRLKNVELIHLHTHGEAKYAHKDYANSFKIANLFVGANMRGYLDLQRVDYIPCFLSEIGMLFRNNIRRPDVALVHVSQPDQHGFCSLGTSVDVAKAAVDTADVVIAQVNPQMPRVHGDGIIHVNDIDFLVEVDQALDVAHQKKLSEVEKAIGKFAAGLIEDGATLQMGIGSIPDAVLAQLKHHKNLGIHTEMWSDGALELIKSGVVNNSQKEFHKGKTVSSFVIGSKEVYDFLNDNPGVVLLEASYVNNPRIISRNKKVAAINSAVEIDLTGQVCADSVGSHIISGVGGQIDFIRGASLSEGGKPIIALPSRTAKGVPRIVPQLNKGAGVVTTRAHVHWVVTEYGATNLFGKTIHERAQALIDIAHPDDREELGRQWLDVIKKAY